MAVGRPSKIRQAGKEAAVRQLAAQGLTSRQISDRLKAEHGLDVSHVAVAKFLKEETQDRRDAARSVAAEEAAESVPLVVDKLRKWVRQIDRLVDEAMAGPRELGKAPGQEDEHPAELAIKRAKLVSSISEDVSRLVNAGVKAAKALHDVTVGDDPASSQDELRSEILGILADQQERGDDGEEDDEE